MENYVENEPDNRFRKVGWVKARFENEAYWRVRKTNEGSNIRLNGIVEYAASPFVFKNRTIHISTDAKEHPKSIDADKQAKIESAYHDCLLECMRATKTQDVGSAVSHALKDVDIECLEVYSVGTANAMLLHGCNNTSGKTRQIIFDIGVRATAIPIQNHSFIKCFRRLRPDIVILSHWDSDHVFGCAYGSKFLFLCPWIAPDPSLSNWKICAGSERVACYLACLKKLFLCNDTGSQITKVSGDHSSLEIWQGAGRPDGQITKQNRVGLILLIRYKNTRPDCIYRNHLEEIEALLPGDVPYSSFPDPPFSTDHVRVLAVPHHCAEMKLGWLSSIPNQGVRKFAISCTQMDYIDYVDIAAHANKPSKKSPNRKHGNSTPVKTDPEHIKTLQNCGFLVFPTGQTYGKLLFCFCRKALLLVGKRFKKSKGIYFLF